MNPANYVAAFEIFQQSYRGIISAEAF
ncbi:hypothetical protein NB311A_18006 [Nitrobacter sp. Nb-311A]|nr:hypothetical protein NB311A_18006 [Nitrobacter sp. Nb-311A]